MCTLFNRAASSCRGVVGYITAGSLTITVWFVLAISTTVPTALAQDVSARYGPSEKLAALRAQRNEVFHYIIRGDAAGLALTRTLAAKASPRIPPTSLEIIQGIAVSLREADADWLSRHPGIIQVWYVHQDLFDDYVHVIQGIEYTVRTAPPPSPINLSLGPPPGLMPLAPHLEEPMNAATHYAASKGFIPIFAIGNYFDADSPNPGVVNPWCLPVWVVCVGAVSADGKTIVPQSSRGLPGKPTTWPTVVANGADVIGPWPTYMKKTDAQKKYDESNLQFMKLVPRGKRDQFTLMSGTSPATAQVSRAAAQIVYFVQQVAKSAKKPEAGAPLFSLTIPNDRLAAIGRVGKRLTGDLGKQSSDGVEVTYRLVDPWRLVKQLLIDTAIPLPSFQPQDVGAGMVVPDYVFKQFGQFGAVHIKLLPVKSLN